MTCACCGGPLNVTSRSRSKRYCSDRCRKRVHNRRRWRTDPAWRQDKRDHARLWRIREVAAGRRTPGGRPL